MQDPDRQDRSAVVERDNLSACLASNAVFFVTRVLEFGQVLSGAERYNTESRTWED